jgi:hypothetical protein
MFLYWSGSISRIATPAQEPHGRSRRDDDAGGSADRGRFAQELVHAPFDGARRRRSLDSFPRRADPLARARAHAAARRNSQRWSSPLRTEPIPRHICFGPPRPPVDPPAGPPSHMRPAAAPFVGLLRVKNAERRRPEIGGRMAGRCAETDSTVRLGGIVTAVAAFPVETDEPSADRARAYPVSKVQGVHAFNVGATKARGVTQIDRPRATALSNRGRSARRRPRHAPRYGALSRTKQRSPSDSSRRLSGQ